MTDIADLKRRQLADVARRRDELRKNPRLRWLFFEITNRCNLFCAHCGSRCAKEGKSLTADDIKGVLRSITGEKPTVCLTGGEPMLHPDFFKIADTVRDMGFCWGMTTNAVLIGDAEAARLRESGMSTVSVSLDGMERSHDRMRGQSGAWKKAVKGITALMKAGFRPQVTTAVHGGNIGELDELYVFLSKLGIDSWRPINVEPIGRACESKDMLLTPEQMRYLLSYIRKKRFDPGCPMEVTYGCSHYLGVGDERMVRDHYFLCGAGILVAGVRSGGQICACLDIEDRDDLVQGNIGTDDFMEVWQSGFSAFRRDRTAGCGRCAGCPERFACGGDSAHTWDWDRKEPLLCLRDFGA